MNLLTNIQPFRKGFHQISVIHTDLVEAEALIRQLAGEEQRHSPEAFAGKDTCVYFKMPYVQPCNPFKELRRLILRIRENTGLRANFKGVVAIELTEWIGHEKEEYFTVLLKYLYDHRSFWRIAAVLNHCTESQVSRFLAACSRYITPRLFGVNLFSDQDILRSTLQQEFIRHGKLLNRDATQLLAETLARPELKDARSLTLLQRTVEEIICCAPTAQTFTPAILGSYLTNPCATLTMMAGKPLFDERSMNHEKDSVQLRS